MTQKLQQVETLAKFVMAENSLKSLKEQEQSRQLQKIPYLKIKHSISFSTNDDSRSENMSQGGYPSENFFSALSISDIQNMDQDFQFKTNKSSATFQPNYNLINNYKLIEVIGKGSFGTVYKAVFLPSCMEVAIKIINFNEFEDQYQQKIVEFFDGEVQILKNLQEKSSFKFTCEFYGAFKHQGCGYLIMELIQGFSLEELIQSELELTIKEEKFYLASLVLALEQLHDNIGCIHRDIKPQNLMVLSNGGLLLLDFGCAKALKKNERTSSITGTCEYFSPSRFKCDYGTEADVWSFGVTAYQLITKKLPFCYKGIQQSHEQQKFHKLSSLLKKQKNIKLLQLSDHDPHFQTLIQDLFNSILEHRFEQYNFNVIKSSKYFQQFNWNQLRRNRLKPPRTFSMKEINDIRQAAFTFSDF